jgi:TonB family protein
MRGRAFLLTAAALALLWVLACPAGADSWRLPKKRKYYSPNKRYYLEVTPKKLGSQLEYFEGKVAGSEKAGARKGAKENRAKGAFAARRADGSYSKRSEFPLVNEVSPTSALVSDGGDYVVTFDNWHGVGYGDDVVVIYRSDGSLVNKFGLGDLLTEGDIETLPRSVSSIWWGGGHYLDEKSGLLVLKVVSNGKDPWGGGANYQELKIELATGRPLEPKRDLFTPLRVISSVDAGPARAFVGTLPGEPSCATEGEGFDTAEAVPLVSEQFYARAKERPLPPYPVIARVARAADTVVVEFLVSQAGDVICVRSLSGHPLFRAAAQAAALKWKFAPVESSAGPMKAHGIVAFNFKLTEKDVNPNNRPQD